MKAFEIRKYNVGMKRLKSAFPWYVDMYRYLDWKRGAHLLIGSISQGNIEND